MRDLVAELEDGARGRFVRWDARLWRELVDGPATELARGLDAVQAGPDGVPVLESYLRLCCEAVGLGYLFPASSGRESFFTLAFGRLVPQLLPALAVERRTHALAALWNLAENLETAPVWLGRVLYRLASSWTTLADLEGEVAGIEQHALGEPAERLGKRPRVVWARPAREDRHFLPGPLHFVTPTVLCVHDRLRAGITQGVWLREDPVLLGALGCAEKPGPAPATGARWRNVAKQDPRAGEPHAAVANAWRGAATLTTSQQLVVLLPD